jgi:hypothetical protein
MLGSPYVWYWTKKIIEFTNENHNVDIFQTEEKMKTWNNNSKKSKKMYSKGKITPLFLSTRSCLCSHIFAQKHKRLCRMEFDKKKVSYVGKRGGRWLI